MKLWMRLAQMLPTGKVAPAIAGLRASLAEQTGDALAISHIQLYEAYNDVAEKNPFLSIPFRCLAKDHLLDAVLCAEFWAEPWGILGAVQIEDGDLGKGLRNVSESIEKQRFWMRNGPAPDDFDRLEFSRRLAFGGTVKCQLGQFSSAQQWFTEALELFKQIETKTRIEENTVEDSIVLGITICLVAQYKYAEAESFIDGVLADGVFSSYPSPARQYLLSSRQLIEKIPDIARTFESQPSAEELWASLWEDVERCETPEAARTARRKILTTIRTHDANREIQSLALAVQNVLQRQLDGFESIKPSAAEPEVDTINVIDMSAVQDLELRESMEKIMQAARIRQQEFEAAHRSLNETVRRMFEVAERTGRNNIASVKARAQEIYSVPARYYAAWTWWSTLRFLVQIVAVAYFLDKVFVDEILKKGLERHQESLFQILRISRNEMIVPVVVLLVGFGLGNLAEKQIADWMLPKYKRLLGRIISDRSRRLWTTYNLFLKLLADGTQALSDIEKRIQDFTAKSRP